MSWWIWILVILGFLMAVAIASYGFIASWRWSYRQRNHDWKTYFKTSKIRLIPGESNQKFQSGLAVIVVGDQWENEDSFLPFLTFAAPNLEEACHWWEETLNHDWNENHETPITKYLQNTNQTVKNIQFYLLCPLKSDKNLEKKWLNYTKKLNLVASTFDKMIYNV
ncbi:hypothetical protein JN01_0129 [Entomoplasma freundtii]|uniref:Uncharacterized protein n=2 Tax=Entomoplasma freundtii TaxID=74700 RepID=A0A2K8NS37_9MOLU|nr:hypothetical protein [Entomoplasma freundtii]ATZ16650.1 hypothetical protein EFREU_v1c06300 [Entomoplasma freundtii]TDY58183.1 hypothetical protein JN01_0129 [Entomoplasma freundtii]